MPIIIFTIIIITIIDAIVYIEIWDKQTSITINCHTHIPLFDVDEELYSTLDLQQLQK